MERTKKVPETMPPGKWLRGLKMFTLVELGEFKIILNKFGVCVCVCEEIQSILSSFRGHGLGP